MEPRVVGLVHDAHASAAQSLDDAVVRERLTEEWIAAGLNIIAAAPSGELPCGQIDRRSGQKAVSVVVGVEQRADFVLQLRVAAAGAP